MSFRLVIWPEADAEVAEAASWYEGKRAGLGAEFLDAFDAATDKLRRQPYLYAPILRDARRVLLQRFPYDVIYEIHGDEVVVLSCFNEWRDPQEWMRRVE